MRYLGNHLDRSQKFTNYRRIESLRECVLVDPNTRRVELFRPGEDSLWNLLDMSEVGQIENP